MGQFAKEINGEVETLETVIYRLWELFGEELQREIDKAIADRCRTRIQVWRNKTEPDCIKPYDFSALNKWYCEISRDCGPHETPLTYAIVFPFARLAFCRKSDGLDDPYSNLILGSIGEIFERRGYRVTERSHTLLARDVIREV